MDFESRTIVNGALLKRNAGQTVSIHLLVEGAEQGDRSFSGKSTDGMPVQVTLNDRLADRLKGGWIEVIGMAGSNDSVRCKEIISYDGKPGEEEFDTDAHNMLCNFLANCRDMYRMG